MVVGLLGLCGTANAATPVGQWAFDEGSGTTAADKAGTHPATLTTGASWTAGVIGSNALSVNGSSFANTGASILDGTKSFSVSAWVKLNQISGFQTAVS